MSDLSPLSAPAAPIPAEPPPRIDFPATPESSSRPSLWRSGVILLLAGAVGLAYAFNPPLTVQAQAGVVMDLPVFVGDYLGTKGEITDVERAILPKDTGFARRSYTDSQGHRINCTIVLSGAEQRSIHRPEACLVGQGWTITDQEQIPIPLASGHPLAAEELTLQRQYLTSTGERVTVRAFYDYWFVGDKVTTASEMHRVLLSNWDRVVHNRAHRWAYVSVFSLITDNLQPNGLDSAQTRELLVNFARQIVPTFQISEMPQEAAN